MANELDPLGIETQKLLDATDFSNARVLEIGAGDGRLTFRYAKTSSFVVAIDPKVGEAASAVDACPSHLAKRIRFVPANALALPFHDAAFDIALLAWSL